MPFEDDEADHTDLMQKTNRVKLHNPTESKTKSPKEAFEERAGEAVAQDRIYKERAFELGKRWMASVRDKTLPENRGPIGKEVEDKLFDQLVMLGMEMNNDPDVLDESIGSIGLITILMKTCLEYRDRLNKLEYELHKINKNE